MPWQDGPCLLVGGHGPGRRRHGRHRRLRSTPRASRWSRPSTSTARASRRSRSAIADALGAADQQVKFRDTVRGVAEVAARAHRVVRGQAVRGRRRVGRAHPLQPLVARRVAQPAVRRRTPATGCCPTSGRWFVAGRAAAPAGPRGAHLPQLQLLRAPAARMRGPAPRSPGGPTTGSASVRVASVVPGPRGGVDQRGAQGLRPELQPVPGAGRPHPGRARRRPAAARATRAGAARPGAPDPGRSRRAAASGRCPASLREALATLQADAVLFPALGDLLGRCIIAVRTSEAEALERMTPDEARLAHLRVF